MTDKEERVLNLMIDYYEKNNYMPTIRELQNNLKYKSTNSIYQYLSSLENKGYLRRDNKRHKLQLVNFTRKSNITNIKVIGHNEYIPINVNNKKDYTCFKISNNYFEKLLIKRNDYLIIEKTNNLNNHDLGLFIINKKYRIMEYTYRNGFFILSDNDQEVLYRVTIIGKVIGIYRKY